MENERILVHKFFSLSYPQIVRVGVELELIRDGDESLSETDLSNAFWKRAKESSEHSPATEGGGF